MKNLPKMSSSFIEAMQKDDPFITEEELEEEWTVVCRELDQHYTEMREEALKEVMGAGVEPFEGLEAA